ncbi:hypothetical protein V8E54_002475 [Elaphomyces granulatus]
MGNLFLRQYLILRIQQLSVVLSTYDSTKRDHFHMHLLSLLLPLFAVFISASEPNTSLSLRYNTCTLIPMVDPGNDLTPCGSPGYGIIFGCTCCGNIVACIDLIETCRLTADGAYACFDNPPDVPDPLPSTSEPLPSTSEPLPSTNSADSSPSTATAPSISRSTTTTTASPITSSKVPSPSPSGSMGLRADIVRVVFVTGLLLAFVSTF